MLIHDTGSAPYMPLRRLHGAQLRYTHKLSKQVRIPPSFPKKFICRRIKAPYEYDFCSFPGGGGEGEILSPYLRLLQFWHFSTTLMSFSVFFLLLGKRKHQQLKSVKILISLPYFEKVKYNVGYPIFMIQK